jgi:hypothetical protein
VSGGPVTFTISNFCPDTLVTFAVGSTVIGTGTADATGSASISTSAPVAPGSYTVTGTSNGTGSCALVASMSVVVQALPGVVLPDTGAGATTPAAGTGANIALPVTGGGGTMPGLRIGATALIVGLGLFGGAKLRRRSRLHTPG